MGLGAEVKSEYFSAVLGMNCVKSSLVHRIYCPYHADGFGLGRTPRTRLHQRLINEFGEFVKGSLRE